jgi:serine/threonine protein phosphatase PrpC
MSNSSDKIKNSQRRYADQTAIEKQIQLARNYGYHKLDSGMNNWRFLIQPHRNHKKHIFNCGDPRCYMCGNPRRWFKEITIQEKKFLQDKFHHYDDDDIVRGYN